MNQRRKLRLFLDSNVIAGEVISPWGLDKATLSLCAARICSLVLAEAVREEVEENILLRATRLPSRDGDRLMESYHQFLILTQPEKVSHPTDDEVHSSRHLIRHSADVPVLLSAMVSRPDWLLTNNTKHFTKAVAQRTSLRIATPADFFRTLAANFR